MVYRKKPNELMDVRPVLDVMGRCRKAAIAAQNEVVPFGPTYNMLRIVTTAIDAAASFLTGGNDTYYHAGGSAPSMEINKWRDSGTPE